MQGCCQEEKQKQTCNLLKMNRLWLRWMEEFKEGATSNVSCRLRLSQLSHKANFEIKIKKIIVKNYAESSIMTNHDTLFFGLLYFH